MNASWSNLNSSFLHPNSSILPGQSGNQSVPIGYLPRHQIIIWAIITSLITTVGIFACITVTAVILKVNQKSNSSSNLLIINYLMMHLIVCAINTPIVIYFITQRNVNHVTVPNICPPVQFLAFSIDQGIDWTNLALAITRIIALRFPTKYSIVAKRPVTWFIIAITWMACFPTNVPYFFAVGGYYAMVPGGRCGVRITSPHIVVILTAIGSYLPFGMSMASAVLLLATVLNIKWTNRLRVQVVNPVDGAPRPTRTMDRRVRLAQTLLGATLFDALCTKTWTLIGATYPRVFQMYPMASIVICLLNHDYRKRLLHFTSSTVRPLSTMRRSAKSGDATDD